MLKMHSDMRNLILILITAIASAFITSQIIVNIPDGYLLINQSELDSLNAISQLPPDTVMKIDTLYVEIKGDAVTHPEIKDSTVQDSLIRTDLKVYLKDTYYNGGIKREWNYRVSCPELIRSTYTINNYIPKPVFIERVKKETYRYYIMVGYGFNGISGSGGIVRGRYMLGLDVGKSQASLKAGILF